MLTIADHVKLELGARAPLSYGALYHAVRQQCMDDSRDIHHTIRDLMGRGHVVAYDSEAEIEGGLAPYSYGLDWTDNPHTPA